MNINIMLTFGVSLLLTLLIMPKLIPFLHKIKFSQIEREEGPSSHKVKSGTPTMGGIVFVLIPVIVFLLFNVRSINMEVIILIVSYLSYGLIGFLDDYLIVVRKNNDGLKPRYKLLLQSILAILFFFLYKNIAPTTLYIPIIHAELDLGIAYFILIFIMFMAESNAVNLTDGLDGLSAGISIIVCIPFILLALRQQHYEVAIFLFGVLASLIGYMKFNKHPAQIFMGDTGSLALGGLFAATAMILKQELALIIIGGMFTLELLSVVIQVTSFKLTGKRIFRMAPLHHHFELGGMKEVRVVHVFYLCAAIFAFIGFWLGVI